VLPLKLHVIAWALVGGLVAALAWSLFGLSPTHALVFALPLSLLAAPVSWSAAALSRSMPLSKVAGVRVALTASAAAVVAGTTWAAMGQAWWRMLDGLGVPPAPGRPLVALLAGVGATVYLLSVTVHYMVQAVSASADLARRELESQVAAREAELRALRAQIDPHFLFNSLNAMSGLVVPEPARAREMIRRLAGFLRESLVLGRTAQIPLAQELALVEQYLEIERVRFGSRLQFVVTSEAATDTPVPPLLLQPLVENAVRHGIATCLEGGVITVRTEQRGDLVWITVENPRDPDGARPGTGFGLDIVRRRLSAMYGHRGVVATEAGDQHYRVSLTLPCPAKPENVKGEV
jgi:signal transduction histidine kinase